MPSSCLPTSLQSLLRYVIAHRHRYSYCFAPPSRCSKFLWQCPESWTFSPAQPRQHHLPQRCRFIRHPLWSSSRMRCYRSYYPVALRTNVRSCALPSSPSLSLSRSPVSTRDCFHRKRHPVSRTAPCRRSPRTSMAAPCTSLVSPILEPEAPSPKPHAPYPNFVTSSNYQVRSARG